MRYKRLRMLASYYAVVCLGLANVILRLLLIIFNPLNAPFIWIQFIPLISISIAIFMYYRLYRDVIPILTLFGATFVHGLISFLFLGTVPIKLLLIVTLYDILYVASTSIKASYFPYMIGDDDEIDDDDDLDDKHLSV